MMMHNVLELIEVRRAGAAYNQVIWCKRSLAREGLQGKRREQWQFHC